MICMLPGTSQPIVVIVTEDMLKIEFAEGTKVSPFSFQHRWQAKTTRLSLYRSSMPDKYGL
jgi:hypothetical protein